MPALIEAMERVAAGETVVEPVLYRSWSAPQSRRPHSLAPLMAREREILPVMAEGRTDREALWLSQKTFEAHVRSIFRKLDLPAKPSDDRRVHAVLRFLRQTSPQAHEPGFR